MGRVANRVAGFPIPVVLRHELASVTLGQTVPANIGGDQGGVDVHHRGRRDAIDVDGRTLRFFEQWLKGVDEGHSEEAPIDIFVMGANEWRKEWEWPLACTRSSSITCTAVAGHRPSMATAL